MEVTIHYAKTHLSRLLKEVAGGETIVILRGEQPVARLVPVGDLEPARRPELGAITSEPVSWTEDAFKPATDRELEEWGL